jgi:serine/threonine-protein phosphatase 2A activator
MKKGPFYEHSPTLYDISGVPYWAKINSGMIKMYTVEVLGKFPVVQHFPIGDVFFPLEVAKRESSETSTPKESTPG